MGKTRFVPSSRGGGPAPLPGPWQHLAFLALVTARSGWARPPAFCFDLALISGNRGLTVGPLSGQSRDLTNPASGKALPFSELSAQAAQAAQAVRRSGGQAVQLLTREILLQMILVEAQYVAMI